MDEKGKEEKFMIAPKKFGTIRVNGKYPIVALIRMPEKPLLPEKNDFEKIKFLEWIFLKHPDDK